MNARALLEALRARALAEAERRVRDLEGAAPAADVVAALEAVGAARAAGASPDSLSRVNAALDPGVASRALADDAALGFDALEEAALALLAAALAGDDPGEHEAAVRGALAARARAENVRLGAELVGAPIPDLALAFVIAHDELVAPALARLTAWNDARGELAAAIAPEHRARFAFVTKAVHVAPSAIAHVAAVAELARAFPEVRERLAPAPAAPPRITSLAAWAKARRARGVDAPIAVAASTDSGAITVLASDPVEVSLRGDATLVVDVHAPLAEGAAPSVTTAAGRVVPMAPVPRTLGRFRVDLDDRDAAEAPLTVTIPLEVGALTLRVPPDGDE